MLQAAGSIRRRHLAIPRQRSIVAAAADRGRQDEPGDENNQDISSLVGKVDIRKLETYAQNDPDAYSYSGGLNRANQGVLEFVEMFKAPIKMLHPLLTATQEGNYIGTREYRCDPLHRHRAGTSNRGRMAELQGQQEHSFSSTASASSRFPYVLRVTEEQKIYEKLIQGSELAAPRHARRQRSQTDGAFLGDVAPAQARELDGICQDAGLVTAKALARSSILKARSVQSIGCCC